MPGKKLLHQRLPRDLSKSTDLTNKELMQIILKSSSPSVRGQAFLRLIKTATLKQLKQVVNKVDLDYRDPKSETNAVLVACGHGRVDVLRWLVNDLDQSLDVKDVDEDGPIGIAICADQVAVLHELVKPVEQGGFGLQFAGSADGMYHQPVMAAAIYNSLHILRELNKPVAEGGFGLPLTVRSVDDYSVDQLAMNFGDSNTVAELLKPRELGGYGVPVDNTSLLMHFPEDQAEQYRNTVLFCRNVHHHQKDNSEIVMLDTVTGVEQVYKPDQKLSCGSWGAITAYTNGQNKLLMKAPLTGWSRLIKAGHPDGSRYDEIANTEYYAYKKNQIHEYKYWCLAYPELGPYALQFFRMRGNDGKCYCTYRVMMSVVPGERFDKLFEPGSATTPLQAAQMVLAVLEEFQRIHALGIIHGDATPGNILLEKTNNPDHPYRARFIDFFLAYKKDKNATFYPYYDSGHVYFPPERARFDVRGLPSQDVFEFAGVLKSEIECDGNRDEDTKKLFPAIDKFIRQGKSLSPELRPELQDSISELKQQIHDYQKQYAPAHKRAIAHSEKLFEAAPATKKQRVAHERKCMKR